MAWRSEPSKRTRTAPGLGTNHASMQRSQPTRPFTGAPLSMPPSLLPVRTFASRVLASEIRRRRYVASSFQQLESQIHATTIRADPSMLQIREFTTESSYETPLERFCVWDWVDDPNVVYSRLAFEEARENAAAAARSDGTGKPGQGVETGPEDVEENGDDMVKDKVQNPDNGSAEVELMQK